jgi:hypothetical protein
MKTKQTLLMFGALSALMLPAVPANAADPRPLRTTEVSGEVRIQQPLPCGRSVDLTTSIEQGYVGLTWLQTSKTAVFVDLAQLTMFLAPFHVEANCNGVGGSVEFREIGVRLASAVRFQAVQAGGRDSALFRFRIPKEQFLIYESVIDNAPVKQPETSYQRPSEDVIGLLDLRRQTVQLGVVLANQLHFRAGCEGDRCVIDEKLTGSTTSAVRGGNFGGTLPTVLCTPEGRGNRFTVNASGGATITLGTFTLANNEVIQLLPSEEPGVRLLPSNRGDIRQFQAGPGDAVIIATSAENLAAIAYCR